MKKILIKILCTCLCLSTFSVVASASEMGRQEDQVKIKAERIGNSILKIENKTTNGQETKHVYNLQKLKSALKKEFPKISDNELAKNIRIASGEDEQLIDAMDENTLTSILNCEESIEKYDYIRVSIDGTQQQLTKEQCFNEIADSKKLKRQSILSIASFDANNGISVAAPAISPYSSIDMVSDTYNFPNGWMKITTDALRTIWKANGKESWYVSGCAEWLDVPFWKLEDMITIAVSSGAQYDSAHSPNVEYGLMSVYKRCSDVFHGHQLQGQYGFDMTPIYTSFNAVSYKYSVQGNFGPMGCNNLKDHIEYEFRDVRYYGQYVIFTPINQDFSVQTAYGHRTLALGGVGVSVSGLSISFNEGTERYLSRPLNVDV